MALRTSLLRLASLGVFTGTSLAGTITVGPTGSGAMFDQVTTAVAAAAPGDTILVAAGTYADSVPILVDKPLTILGEDAATTIFNQDPPFLATAPALMIVGIPLGQEVRVSGMSLSSMHHSPWPWGVGQSGQTGRIVQVSDCLGSVVLSDLRNAATGLLFGAPGLIQVLSCDQVLIDSCHMISGPYEQSVYAPAVYVEDSNLVVNDSYLAGCWGFASQLGSSPGSPGINAVQSQVSVANSNVLGGEGSPQYVSGGASATDGGPGIRCVGSQLDLRGGPGNSVLGGPGGLQLNPLFSYGNGAAALDLSSDSSARVTPDVTLLGGPNGLGLSVAPAVAGSGTLKVDPEDLALLRPSVHVVAPGAMVTLELGGEPASLVLPAISLTTAPSLALAGIGGELVVPLGGYLALPARTLDATGQAALPVAIPALPGLAGLSFVAQSLAVSPTGTFSFSAPTAVAVL